MRSPCTSKAGRPTAASSSWPRSSPPSAAWAWPACWSRHPEFRSFAYGFTTVGGLVLGILGAFSIGLPLVALGLLSIYALGRVPNRSWRALLAGNVTAAVLLVVGFATTGPF